MGKFLLRFIPAYLLAGGVTFVVIFLIGERDYLQALMLALPISMVVPLNVMYNPYSYSKSHISLRQVRTVCLVAITLITIAVLLCSVFLSGKSWLLSIIYALSIPAVGFLFFGLWYRMVARNTGD